MEILLKILSRWKEIVYNTRMIQKYGDHLPYKSNMFWQWVCWTYCEQDNSSKEFCFCITIKLFYGVSSAMTKTIEGKVDVSKFIHLNLSGVWLGVDLKTDIKKTCVKKRLDSMFKIW